MPNKKRERNELLAAAGDLLSSYGAACVAQVIENYWRTKGYDSVRAERYELPGLPGVYGVRSNLVGGMPPKPPVVLVRRGEAVLV